MPRPSLQFWFEFASTYSYLSVCRIEQVAANGELFWGNDRLENAVEWLKTNA